MSSFLNSLKLLKDGILLIESVTSMVRRIIALQYNPNSITRILQVQGVGGESGYRSEALRLKEPPVETIKVETKIDVIEQRHLLPASVTAKMPLLLKNRGLAPNLVEGVVLPSMSTSGIHIIGSNPTQTVKQIAQSVYGGIGHE